MVVPAAQAEGEAADDSGAGAMAAREDWFARAATVGRASLGASAELLAHLIADRQGRLQRCAGRRCAACKASLNWAIPLQVLTQVSSIIFSVRVPLIQGVAVCKLPYMACLNKSKAMQRDPSMHCTLHGFLWCLHHTKAFFCFTRAGQDATEALEELHWLARGAAHLLADSGDGETPLPPLPAAAAASGPRRRGRSGRCRTRCWASAGCAWTPQRAPWSAPGARRRGCMHTKLPVVLGFCSTRHVYGASDSMTAGGKEKLQIRAHNNVLGVTPGCSCAACDKIESWGWDFMPVLFARI